jgi:hypothetical protein
VLTSSSSREKRLPASGPRPSAVPHSTDRANIAAATSTSLIIVSAPMPKQAKEARDLRATGAAREGRTTRRPVAGRFAASGGFASVGVPGRVISLSS